MMGHQHDSTTLRRALRGILVAGLAVTLVGCGSDYQVGDDDQPRRNGENGKTPPHINDPDQPDEPDDEPETLILAPVDGNTASVIADQNVPLTVELTNEDGETKTGETIDWQLLGPNGDARISSQQATTADDGTATIDFEAGRDLQTYRVQADHADTDPVVFEVTVEPLPPGILEIWARPPQPQPVAIEDVRVQLYKHSKATCADFKPLAAQQPSGLGGARVDLSTKATFSQLDARPKYTAMVIGYDTRGRKVAAGCGDALEVPSDQVRTEKIVLGTIDRNPKGRYDVRSKWDMRQAFQKTAPMGKRLHGLINAASNPGKAIWNGVLDEIRKRGGTRIAQLLQMTQLGQQIEQAINQEIAKIGFLQKLRRTAQGLKSTLNTMHVDSILTVDAAAPNGERTGQDKWLHAYVWYKANCGPNDPPSCGRHKLEFGGTNNSLNPVVSNWTGRVTDYDTLEIDEHPVELEYGRLMLAVLNDVVIPELTDGNAQSLQGAFEQWFSCKDLADNMANSRGDVCVGGLCIGKSAVTNVCNAGVQAVFSQLEREIVKAIQGDVRLFIGGKARIGILNADGYAEALEDGTFDGRLESNSGKTAPVDATWSGTRKQTQNP